MKYNGKNLLITGLNGFIGSAAAEYFLKQGYHVIGLVKDFNMKTRPEIHKKCSIVHGNILDLELVKWTLSKYEVDYVIHLAANPIVRICNNDPYSAYFVNIMGTLNLLEACRTLKRTPQKILVKTSDKAYGPHASLPYKETSELVVADSYCTSKACQDMIARSYAMTYGLPIIVVRAGNIYGPGDLNLSRLVPNTIRLLLNNQSPVLYSGVAQYIREFIYVDNVANAYDVLLNKGVNGEAYNIGGTEPQKIQFVIEKIRDLISPDIAIEIIEKDFYEIPAQYLDSTKLEQLGWNPKISLEEGLRRTIEWFRKFKI